MLRCKTGSVRLSSNVRRPGADNPLRIGTNPTSRARKVHQSAVVDTLTEDPLAGEQALFLPLRAAHINKASGSAGGYLRRHIIGRHIHSRCCAVSPRNRLLAGAEEA